MHRRETRVLLRHYLEQGLTKTELAKRFGISRRTVYHWIETGQLDRDLDSQEVRYRPRPPVVTRLEPYKSIIQAGSRPFRCSRPSGCSRSCAAPATGRIYAAEGLRAAGAPACAGGTGRAL